MRKIIHVDMDCFYAAVEERERPELRGRAMGVGGAREGRGVLTTCNYEARKYGLHSAMPTFQALAKCPHLIVVPPRFELYRAESARIRAIFCEYTPDVEPLSLDEAYLEVSHLERPATDVAREIRARIFELTGLTASAGVAPNKMLAKIASDFRKPNGQHTVRPEAVESFMLTLPVRKIPGVGSVMAQRLAELGVETCGQLQAFAAEDLARRFGKFGLEVYARCRGVDDRAVEPNRERKSFSNERTFNSNLGTMAECAARLEELFSELCEDLAAKAADRTITKVFVKLRFADFSRTTVERSADQPDIEQCRALLAEGWQRREPLKRSVRLLGVGVRFATAAEDGGERPGRQERESDQLVLAL
jgi:DNA polymerase-4